MIVDTSALVAVAYREDGATALLDALLTEAGLLIAPVVVEFCRVTALALNRPNPAADAAIAANRRYGSGGGLGGPLNLLDLMVYGAAKVSDLPILCTGKDFAKTDIAIHPASRTT